MRFGGLQGILLTPKMALGGLPPYSAPTKNAFWRLSGNPPHTHMAYGGILSTLHEPKMALGGLLSILHTPNYPLEELTHI